MRLGLLLLGVSRRRGKARPPLAASLGHNRPEEVAGAKPNCRWRRRLRHVRALIIMWWNVPASATRI